PGAFEPAALPSVRFPELPRRSLPRKRARLEDGPPAARDHQVRERQVVAETRVDLDVVCAANRVDRTDPACDRSKRRLIAAEPRLEAPVGPFAVRPVGSLVEVAATHVCNLRIGEVANEEPE